ncbi:MAG TPA: sigma-70 family RNA polymerase sigma factor [Gemmataceae bacterium]|nr:sigma-70 family RNA polymerase sigma factor [Gemmataceae bacterium]
MSRRSSIHTTPLTLLERIQQAGDQAAWGRLVELYTPILFAWARRCGEDEHDAADLVQEVFVALVQALPTFQHEGSGRFRRWLRTLLLNKLRDRKRRQVRTEKALAQRPGEIELPDAAELFWEADYHKELARRALLLMQAEFAPSTWKACWQTVVQGRSAAETARELGISENAVYIARCRVLRRLRQELGDLME